MWRQFRYLRRLIGTRTALEATAGQARSGLVRATVCRAFGHAWKHKMYDDVCNRCSVSQPRMGVRWDDR